MDNTHTSKQTTAAQTPRIWLQWFNPLLMASIFVFLGIQNGETIHFVTAGGFMVFLLIPLLQLMSRNAGTRLMLPVLFTEKRNLELVCTLMACIGFCLVVGSLLFRWLS